MRFNERRNYSGLLLGVVVFLTLFFLPMDSLSPEAHRLAAILGLVITFWMTEMLPLGVTALLGLALAVILQVTTVENAFAPMAHPLIFLFIGSFILAQALFVHRVNERIAYTVLSWKWIGARPSRILVAYGVLAAFLSAWMSNTATAAMLVPIGMSLIKFMESENKLPSSYGTALMLMTAYGCAWGGMVTPVGTPPNLIAIGMLRDQLGINISFVDWMLLTLPISFVLMVIVIVYLNYVGRAGIKEISGATQLIAKRRKELGPLRTGERNAIIAFGITICLWIIPGILPLLFGSDHLIVKVITSSVPESVAALIGAALLFILPISSKEPSTITWKQAVQIDWGTILLFGGGLSFGALSVSTGLAQALGGFVSGLFPTDTLVPLTYASALFTVILSEAMSNTAATNIAIPIVIPIAQASGVDPVIPVLAAALAASLAVLLPVSTPPNAIVYASGRVSILQMFKYGLLIDLVAVVIVPMMVLMFM